MCQSWGYKCFYSIAKILFWDAAEFQFSIVKVLLKHFLWLWYFADRPFYSWLLIPPVSGSDRGGHSTLYCRRNRYTGAGEPRGTTDYEYGYGPIHYVLRLQVPEPNPKGRTIVYHLFRVSVLRWPWWPLCPGLAPLLIRPGPGSREWRVWSVTKANTPDTETIGTPGPGAGLSWWLLSPPNICLL